MCASPRKITLAESGINKRIKKELVMKRQERVNTLRAIKDNKGPLFFMLGPCSIESESHALKAAEFLAELSEKLSFPLIYKSSFDKANRLSGASYRSIGFDEGLRILEKIGREFDLPIVTDVHETSQVDAVAQVADVIQIPAFLCRQTDLLVAAGQSGKIVNIKKGQFLPPEGMAPAAQKVVDTGNNHVWLCERGFTFGYNNLIVDFRAFPIMKQFGFPVVFDATHAVQRPAGMGNCSGGDRQFVGDLAISAVAQGIAGIFMEVHPEPEKAPCDGPNMVRFSQLEALLRYLIELDCWIKSQQKPFIS